MWKYVDMEGTGLTIWASVLSLLLFITGAESWPEGTYGLPMAASGCPVSDNFEWETGTRTQNTEKDSHASDPIHLAGITPHKTDAVVQNFCMKTSYTKDGDYEFTKGRYCIFKKGDCPAGFKQGWIYWDDDSPIFWSDDIQNYSGSLPEGEYDSNTKIYYCCRNDGSASHPLKLPSKAPFYLFRVGEQCQQVEGMTATDEWVYWADEDTFNLNGRGGLYPALHRSRYPWRYTKLYYCYYQPRGTSRNLQTALTVIYALAGAVGLILVILVAVCIMQKLCTHKSDPFESGARESMLHSTGPTATTDIEPSVIYRPANGQAKASKAKTQEPVDNNFTVQCPSYPGPPPEAAAASNNPSAPEEAAPEGDENRPISQPPTYEQVLREKLAEIPKTSSS